MRTLRFRSRNSQTLEVRWAERLSAMIDANLDFADSTFLTDFDFFAIGDVVSVFFDLAGLLIPKFFVPFVGVLTSGRIFQNFSASSRVTAGRNRLGLTQPKENNVLLLKEKHAFDAINESDRHHRTSSTGSDAIHLGSAVLLFHTPLGNSSAHLFQFRLKHDKTRLLWRTLAVFNAFSNSAFCVV